MALALTVLTITTSAVHNDYRWQIVRPYNAKLERMAVCESHPGGKPRWHLDTHNGFFGGLQFKLSTWKSVGGRGYPNQNSELEQKYRAVKLIKKYGYNPWPICGSA